MFVSGFVTANPITNAVAVVPSDTVSLALVPTRGLYVGVAGNVTALLADDSVVTFTGLTAGVVHPIAIKRVNLTATTATTMLALY